MSIYQLPKNQNPTSIEERQDHSHIRLPVTTQYYGAIGIGRDGHVRATPSTDYYGEANC
jgi:hypothetical protein